MVISQVYGGGGNSGATYKNDFVELFNPTAAPVTLAGWSVQYASSTGTSWQVTPLPTLTLQPGQYLLVQEALGAAGTTNLPTPDATGTISMSATAGKVALVSSTTALSGLVPNGRSDAGGLCGFWLGGELLAGNADGDVVEHDGGDPNECLLDRRTTMGRTLRRGAADSAQYGECVGDLRHAGEHTAGGDWVGESGVDVYRGGDAADGDGGAGDGCRRARAFR